MNKLFYGLVFATVAAVAVPNGVSNHGQVANYNAVGTGCVLSFEGVYNSGNFDDQVWDFVVSGAGAAAGCATTDVCQGYGSLEIGFTGIGCMGGAAFSTGGIGHFHPYPNLNVDTHPTWVNLNGNNITGTVSSVG